VEVATTSGYDDPGVRVSYRASFEELNERLATTKFDRYLRFLNFGYAPIEGEAPVGPPLPRNFPNRDSAQLLFNVVGDTDLSGRIVEVGCGRGGNLALLHSFYDVGSSTGLDLASANVAFCRRSYRSENMMFVQGDAERLPFRRASVDVILNIESSGCYPDIECFFREVARTARPGGWFLWADLARREMIGAYRRVLAELGFEVTTDREITANVLASRSRRAERQRLAFGDGRKLDGFDDWVGAAGSELYEQLVDERCAYQIMRARRRPGSAVSDSALFTDEEREMAMEFAQFGARVLGASTSAGLR